MKISFILLQFIYLFFLSNNINGQILRSDQQNNILSVKLKEYEFEEHEKFQEELNIKVKKYFIDQSKKFIDEETGFFGIWGETIYFFESSIKKESRWKSRIEKYFRTTAFQTYVQNEINNYTETINKQRLEIIENATGIQSNQNGLEIQLKSLSSIELNSEIVIQTVSKIQEMVVHEVVPEIIDLVLGPLFLFPLLSSLIGLFIPSVNGILGKIKIICLVVLIIYPLVQSIRFSNNLEKYLINSLYSFDEKQFYILPDLNENSNVFFEKVNNNLKK
ncbi:hypothetical protein P872_21875 [Rhodonellum psychrophilum GCM71 = DSM 17998]|uniref:Uncharacterized protein n=2 Tax=Rhodonellum TaxID=336827 RepID=U5BV19_9BACT|nr:MULTISPECIES: hypothetical protein [Rhodonellum]ERM80431.1 hypothetical protein P872_21875 [Rhodonellum psychrophilum GCM71 = DSM 17998]SDZ24802.1 hypothetical protein SAMN05444412_108105 [Rhodonellum ikkaensis]